jgi:sensor histidine kinase YesM
MDNIIIILTKSRFRIFWHILFWILVLVFYTFYFGHQGGYYSLTFQFVIFLLPIAIGTTYLFNYYLIPKFLFQKRIKTFILLSFYTVMVSFYLISILIFPFLIISTGNVNFVTLDKSFLDIYFLLAGMYTAIIFGILIKLLKSSYEKQNLHLQLLKEKTDAELEMLRSQINPHFLFNTLNNIYTLSMKKSELTPEVVLKLSEMLDYLLYECNATKVSLKKEIKLIENYLYLQQIRFGDRLKISFRNEDLGPDQQIAPMLLLPFVENSFKHGVGKHRNDAWIDIELSTHSENIIFKVNNSQSNTDAKTKKNSSGGIGLANVKKRLGLIYPDKFMLNIENMDKAFRVNLELNVAI